MLVSILSTSKINYGIFIICYFFIKIIGVTLTKSNKFQVYHWTVSRIYTTLNVHHLELDFLYGIF